MTLRALIAGATGDCGGSGSSPPDFVFGLPAGRGKGCGPLSFPPLPSGERGPHWGRFEV